MPYSWPEIFYTTDGTQPDTKSNKFVDAFKVKPGTQIRARAISSDGWSQTTTRSFGYDKSNWKIISATGLKDQPESRKRAANAIDGDHFIPWVPDRGQNAAGYPHEIVIDMGSVNKIRVAKFRFLLEMGAPKSVRIEGSTTSQSQFDKLVEANFESFSNQTEIKFNEQADVRYLKFVFQSPREQSDVPMLMIGEIDVF